jgi:hypothetical protein
MSTELVFRASPPAAFPGINLSELSWQVVNPLKRRVGESGGEKAGVWRGSGRNWSNRYF